MLLLNSGSKLSLGKLCCGLEFAELDFVELKFNIGTIGELEFGVC